MPFGSFISRRSPRIAVGHLRHKIDLVLPNTTQDSTGGLVQTSIVYANVWASIEAIMGMERMAAKQMTSTATHQIVIRYIGPAMSWQKQWAYTTNFVVLDSNGNLQQAQAPGGLSGAAAPTWNTTLGGFTSDGDPSTGLVWKNLGAPINPRSAITAAMVVWFGGRIFQIEDVLNPDERTKMLVLVCCEVNDSRQQDTATQPGGLT